MRPDQLASLHLTAPAMVAAADQRKERPMGKLILARLREPSTWAGIAGLVAGVSVLPHAGDVAQSITLVGGAIAGLLAIWMPEAKG